MATHSLNDRLVFTTDTGESLLPPECALLVLTSTLAIRSAFLQHHFLREILKSTNSEGAVLVSFLHPQEQLASGMKKMVEHNAAKSCV